MRVPAMRDGLISRFQRVKSTAANFLAARLKAGTTVCGAGLFRFVADIGLPLSYLLRAYIYRLQSFRRLSWFKQNGVARLQRDTIFYVRDVKIVCFPVRAPCGVVNKSEALG